MLSVGLCLSARLPAGLLVFFGFVGSFGSIDHRLQQFELLPCGAVQTVDFFDHIVGVGGCDPFSEFVPSLFRFGVILSISAEVRCHIRWYGVVSIAALNF